MRRLIPALSRLLMLTGLVIAYIGPASAQAQSTVTVTGVTDLWITVTDPVVVTIRTYAQQYGIDSHLWLYDPTDSLVVSNDDYYGLDSYLSIELSPGTYRLRAGRCCGDPDNQFNGSYDVESSLTPVATTTTTTTTTTTEPTTTTSTTTTIEPTTSTTTSTTTTTTTTEPTTTTGDPSSLPPEAPSTSIPIETPTTGPSTTSPVPVGTTTTSTTSSTVAPSTTSTSTPSTTDNQTSTTSVQNESTTTTTTPTSTVPDQTVPVTTEPDQPPVDATDDQKRDYEAQVNVFDGTHDDYIPAGSTITVGQRRSVIAATSVSMILPTPTTSARRYKDKR